MLNQPTIEKLHAMKLHGMADAFREQLEMADSSQLSFEERLGFLVDRQGGVLVRTDRGRGVIDRHDACSVYVE